VAADITTIGHDEGLRVRIFYIWAAAAALLAASHASAQTTNITPTLIAETDNPAAASTITLALAMKPAKDWHGY